MKIAASGPVHERVTAIAGPAYPVYAVRGDDRVLLVDSGINLLGPRYLASIAELFPGPRQPGMLFLTHSHWDHVGSADYLRRHIPGLKIGAHERTATVVRKPSALETMNRLSADQIEALGRGPIDDELRLRPFEVDILLRHGEEFNLGGLTCRVHETPGHTRDSLAFFFPEIGALFPGDAGGVLRDRPLDKIQPAFVASYQAYVDSLRSMIALNPKIICPAHGWVLTHDDATGFLRDSLATTLAYRELIENILDAAGGDVEEAIQRLAQIEYEGAADRGEPVSAYVTNLTAQVKHIAGQRSHKRDNGSRSAGE